MRRRLKKWMKNFAYKIVQSDGINIGLYIIIFAVLIWRKVTRDSGLEILDWTIFFSMAAVACLQFVSNMICSSLKNRLEDSIKLDDNYEKLCKMYPEIICENGENRNPLITYKNPQTDALQMMNQKRKKDCSVCRFPVIMDADLYQKRICIEDTDEQYKLPEEIKEHFDELFSAHDTSNVYNQLNIRVKSWEQEGETFQLQTMRTTYFDSLVTNRAMDFRWQSGQTIRDLFSYGPFVKPLSKSGLSNHLGFNGFIISSDGMIPFVKRNGIVSIGKRTYGDSIGASLKAKYALDSQGRFTLAGLQNSILKEIKDELKIDVADIEFSVEKNMIAAYRDLVEGGKPQFLFAAKVNRTHNEITEEFIKQVKEKKKKSWKNRWDKEQKELEDGEVLLWISVSELKEMAISAEGMVYKQKEYAMMPSASAAIVMLIRWLDESDGWRKYEINKFYEFVK